MQWTLGPPCSLLLAPKTMGAGSGRHQPQLTIADWLHEADIHHPLENALYYGEQTAEAKKRAGIFKSNRMPKFLGYFERILKSNSKDGAASSSARGFPTSIYHCSR